MTNVPGPAPVWGLVLIGGQSTRMGQDKSGLVYHGLPQRDHLTVLLGPLCQRVYWSVNEAQNNTLSYPHLLPDRYPQQGPLGGLLTAFEAHPQVAWLLVPCDLPHLDAGTLRGLLAGRRADSRNENDPNAPLVTAYWDAEKTGAEPLVSLWEPEAGPVLRAWFMAGNRSPRQFMVQHPTTRLVAPNYAVFENVNTPPGSALA